MDVTEVEPLIEPPAALVEDVDTKSIRIPVVHQPLPDPVLVRDVVTDEDRVIPKRPNILRRVLPLSPVRVRRRAS